MSTILNIRGTNGSGKSSLVRQLMQHLGTNDLFKFDGKPAGYRFTRPDGQRIFVLGKYTTACGGLDSTFSYKNAADDVILCIDLLAEKGDVICEGVVAMSSYGFARLSNLATSQEQKGNQVIFALLDTPLEVCIQRTQARRAAKAALNGKEPKPFNPENLSAKWHSTHKDQRRLAGAGYDCRTLPYQDPLPTLLQWLGLMDPSPPGVTKVNKSTSGPNGMEVLPCQERTGKSSESSTGAFGTQSFPVPIYPTPR